MGRHDIVRRPIREHQSVRPEFRRIGIDAHPNQVARPRVERCGQGLDWPGNRTLAQNQGPAEVLQNATANRASS